MMRRPSRPRGRTEHGDANVLREASHRAQADVLRASRPSSRSVWCCYYRSVLVSVHVIEAARLCGPRRLSACPVYAVMREL
jgi:hypothetical protein